VSLKKISELVAESRLIIFFARVPQRYRWMATFSVVGSLFFIWFLLVYLPLHFQLSAGRNQLQVSEDQYLMLQKKVVECEEAGKESTHIARDWKRNIVCSDGRLTEFLLDIGKKTKVICQRIMPLKVERLSFYERGDYQIVVQGQFFNFIDFVKRLSRARDGILFETIKVDRIGKGKVKAELVLSLIKDAYV